MRALLAAILFLVAVAQCHATVRGGTTTSPLCSVTKNIVTDYSANNTNTADVAAAFNNFHTDAIAANPNAVCLTIPAGTYGFIGLTGSTWASGIQNLYVNGAGPTSSILTDTAATLAAQSATSNTITFASLPATIISGLFVQDATTPAAIPNGTTATVAGNVVTTSQSITVAPGDQIQFLGHGFSLGASQGIIDNNTQAANTTAQNIGDSCTTLLTTAQTSLFNVNDWAIMSGIELQFAGSPPNLGVFEYVQISSINSGTGQICFTAPLQHKYETTWPNYFAGNGGAPYGGGPATLYVLNQVWNITQTYSGLGFAENGASLEITSKGKSVTFNNVKFVVGNIFPSQNQSFVCNSCDMSQAARIEFDKLFTNAVFNGGTLSNAVFQSGTLVDSTTFNGSIMGAVIGTGGKVAFNNVTASGRLQMGASCCGVTQQVTCNNSSFSTFALAGVLDTSTSNVLSTMSGGVISIPTSLEKPVGWALPGADAYWNNTFAFNQFFSVVDITASGGNTLLQTDQAGGFPTVPGTGQPDISSSVARTINFNGCSGSPQLVDMSQAGARNARPFTYSNRIYTCTNNVATIQAANPSVPVVDINSPPSTDPIIARVLVSIVANVSVADTSANGTVNLSLGGTTVNSSGTAVGLGTTINLKTAGSRSYNAGTSTWTGGQTGDTLPTLTNPSYMAGLFVPSASTNISGDAANTCPVVTVTFQTN